MRYILPNLVAFLFLGMAIVALIFGIILFSYLLLYGAAIGLVLFAILWIRDKLFPKKEIQKFKRHGRIIEHEDHK